MTKEISIDEMYERMKPVAGNIVRALEENNPSRQAWRLGEYEEIYNDWDNIAGALEAFVLAMTGYKKIHSSGEDAFLTQVKDALNVLQTTVEVSKECPESMIKHVRSAIDLVSLCN